MYKSADALFSLFILLTSRDLRSTGFLETRRGMHAWCCHYSF